MLSTCYVFSTSDMDEPFLSFSVVGAFQCLSILSLNFVAERDTRQNSVLDSPFISRWAFFLKDILELFPFTCGWRLLGNPCIALNINTLRREGLHMRTSCAQTKTFGTLVVCTELDTSRRVSTLRVPMKSSWSLRSIYSGRFQ
jgi:hypothetical protein